MRRPPTWLPLAMAALLLGACRNSSPAPQEAAQPREMNWAEIVHAAHGQTVTLAMWQGDPAINAYMQKYVASHLKKDYGITLTIIAAQGGNIVTQLMTEIEAGSSQSAYDMVWINGSTFYQLRQIRGLFGPFTDKLPNNVYVNWASPFIAYDFQQPVDGYECPWGNVQLLLITDSARVPIVPRSPQALAAWIHAHPGRFTFDTSFTGLGFLKSLMYAFADSPAQLQGPFNQARYEPLKRRLFAWVRGVRADLWHHGESFPTDVAQLHQLFANGEVDFTMSFNDGEVGNKIDIGLFPPTAQAFVLDTGTLQNSHYLGITAGAAHKAAAMVVANFLISPAAQLEKQKPDVWGDGTVLDVHKLPPEWRERFESLAARSHAPPRAQIEGNALREPAPELMIHLSNDFNEEILGR
ncbi:MAG: ABC transporter substrate-binding protein [Steroidobacteraceae bacterium]